MASSSRRSLVSAVLTICLFCLSSAQDTDVHEAANKCTKELNITNDDILSALSEKVPEELDKKVLRCMVEALGMLDQDGSVNTEKLHAFANRRGRTHTRVAGHKATDTSDQEGDVRSPGVATEKQYSRRVKYDYEDAPEGYMEPNHPPFGHKKALLHSKKTIHASLKSRERRQAPQPPVPQQSPGSQYPSQQGQNFPGQQQSQNYPSQPQSQNFPGQQGQNYPSQQEQNYPKQNHEGRSSSPLLPLERVLSRLLQAAERENSPEGPFNGQNGQQPYNQPYDQNRQQPYSQNGPYPQNPQIPPSPQSSQPSPQSSQPFGQSSQPFSSNSPFNQRSKRSPQELVLTSAEIAIPPELASQLASTLRQLFLSLLESGEGGAANTSNSVPESADSVEQIDKTPRKRREEPAPPTEEMPLEMLMKTLREGTSNGMVAELVRSLRGRLTDAAALVVGSAQGPTPPPRK